MSEIRYYTDGEQATAATLNRPLEDLNNGGQYMSKVQFEALAADRREKFAGSGMIDFGSTYSESNGWGKNVNKGLQIISTGADWRQNMFTLGRRTSNKPALLNVNGDNIRLDGTDFTYDTIANQDFASSVRFPENKDVPIITDVTNIPEMKQGDFAILNDVTTDVHKINGASVESAGTLDDNGDGTYTLTRKDQDGSNAWYHSRYRKYTVGLIYKFTLEITDNPNNRETLGFGMYGMSILSSTGIVDNKVEFTFRINDHYNSNAMYINGLGKTESITFKKPVITIEPEQIVIANNNITSYNYIDSMTKFDKRNSISRQDLVFLETWHEDISQKGIVYPYGNIQYKAGNTDGLSGIAEGTFTGYDTYSLFGNWQTPGDLVGNGYIWDNLSNSQQLKFTSNKDNNIYKDGDKIIQVRYRIRVIKGIGNDYTGLKNSMPEIGRTSVTGTVDNAYLIPKGSDTFSEEMGMRSVGANRHYIYTYEYGRGTENGTMYSDTRGTDDFSYNNVIASVQIALVQRRNIGAYDPVFNPEGSAVFSDGKKWFETSASHNNLIDCFNNKGDSTIGTVSGRPDGLYADEINERDVEDLRMSAHKRDYKELMDEYNNKGITGEIRGKENDIQTYWKPFWLSTSSTSNTKSSGSSTKYIWDDEGKKYLSHYNIFGIGDNTNNKYRQYLIEWVDVNRVSLGFRFINEYSYTDQIHTGSGGAAGFNILAVKDNGTVSNNTMTHTDIIGDPRKLQGRVKYTTTGSAQSVSLGKNDYILNAVAGSGASYAGTVGDYYRFVGTPGTIDLDNVDYTTTDFVDLGSDGTIGGYKDQWLENGIEGSPLLVGENGESLLPVDVNTIGHYITMKISKKCSGQAKSILVSKKDGQFLTTSYNGSIAYSLTSGILSTTNNARLNIRNSYEDLGYASEQEMLDLMVVLVTYEAKANFLELANNNKVVDTPKLGNFAQWRSAYGSVVSNSLLNKVTTGSDNGAYPASVFENFDISIQLDDSYDRVIPSSSWALKVSHRTINASDGGGGAKYFPYLTETNSVAKVQYVFKEMKWDNDLDDNNDFADIDTITSVSHTKGEKLHITDGAHEGYWECVKNISAYAFDDTRWQETNSELIWVDGGDGKAYFKRWDGNGWGDNNKFEITDKISTLTDDNGNTVLYGQKSFNLPYFIK